MESLPIPIRYDDRQTLHQTFVDYSDDQGILRLNSTGVRLIPTQSSDGAHDAPTYMQHPHDIFQINCSLGQGTYAHVYGATDITNGKQVTIKILPLPATRDEYLQILREIRILQDCANSPYLVKMHEAYIVGQHLWIMMEYCAIGSLENLIQENGPLSELQTAAAIKQILYGLLSLHNNKLIHRDIKPANILIDENGCFKLADFGLAAVLTQTLGNANSLCGTPYYVSPEVCLQKPYSYKTDNWSLGILTFFLLTGAVPPMLRPLGPQELLQYIPNCPPAALELPGKPSAGYIWTNQSDKQLSAYVMQTSQPIPPGQHWSEDAKDFLRCCLIHDPEKRWDVRQLLQHKFIYQVPRFVQPSRTPRVPGQPLIDPFTLPIDPLQIQLLAIPEPKHGAWPTCSTYVAIAENIKTYLKSDDWGLGSTINFINKFPTMVTRSVDAEALRFILLPVSFITHHYRGNTSKFNPQVARNLKLTEIIVGALNNQNLANGTSQSYSDNSIDSEVFVRLANSQPPIDNTPLLMTVDETPKSSRPLAGDDSQETASKQQRVGDTRTAREAYNLSPQSTASGHVKDIQQANNP